MTEAVVYSRFFVQKQDGTKVKLKIQEIRECDVEKLVKFMTKGIIHEETYMRCSGIGKNEKSTQEFSMLLTNILMKDTNIVKGVVCYEDKESIDDLEIVGCNVFDMYNANEEDDLKEIESIIQEEESKALFRIITVAHDHFDTFKHYGVDSYVGGLGLSVAPSYRGCGIATQLLKARKPLMERHGLKLTTAWFTSAASQRCAEKAGYETAAEIAFQHLEEATGVHFTDTPPTTKLMVLKSSLYK